MTYSWEISKELFTKCLHSLFNFRQWVGHTRTGDREDYIIITSLLQGFKVTHLAIFLR